MSNNIKEIKALLQAREVRKNRLLTQKEEYEAEVIEFRKQQQQALTLLEEEETLLNELRADFAQQENSGQIRDEDRDTMIYVENRLSARIEAARKDQGEYTKSLQIATQNLGRATRKLQQVEMSCSRLNEMLKKFSASLSPGIFSTTLKSKMELGQEFQEMMQSEHKEAIQWACQDAMEQVFICSITQQEMNDPVVLEGDGNSYERVAIKTWLAKNNSSPLTGLILNNKNVWPNHALKRVIDAVRENKPFHSFFICPLTKSPMQDPVILADGHSYEQAAVKDWLNFFPNHALKSVIEAAPECVIPEKAAPPLKKIYPSNVSIERIIRQLM